MEAVKSGRIFGFGEAADEPENLTLKLSQEMREGFAQMREEMNRRFDKLETHIEASDAENAKVLEMITHDVADLKTIFVDLHARVVRNERRVTALEERRPDA